MPPRHEFFPLKRHLRLKIRTHLGIIAGDLTRGCMAAKENSVDATGVHASDSLCKSARQSHLDTTHAIAQSAKEVTADLPNTGGVAWSATNM